MNSQSALNLCPRCHSAIDPFLETCLECTKRAAEGKDLSGTGTENSSVKTGLAIVVAITTSAFLAVIFLLWRGTLQRVPTVEGGPLVPAVDPAFALAMTLVLLCLVAGGGWLMTRLTK